MPVLSILGAICVFFLIARITFKVFFKDWDDLKIHLTYLFTPDLISAFRNEFEEDQYSSLKVYIWLGIALVMGAITYFLIANY